jgi:subtilisin family serine protease
VQSRAALSGSPAAAQFQKIQSAQQAVIAELNRRGVRPAGAAQTLLNAVFVSVDRNTALELRNVPGVAAVLPAPPLKPALYTAGDLVNLTQAQALAPSGASNAGAGVKIGILDSGIDIDHAAFQDSSLTPPAGYPKGETAYTNNKVIVARSFVESLPWPDPDSRNTRPDDLSPRDRVGHGTAIAMIAAGVRNTGPLGTIQGVAPKAFLGNYKVQGSPGVNLVKAARVVAALEQAYSDGMDIVTVAYSEGDMWNTGPLDNTCGTGYNEPCDIIAAAVETASGRGMLVVVAAGNDGAVGSKLPTLNTIHSPGTAFGRCSAR